MTSMPRMPVNNTKLESVLHTIGPTAHPVPRFLLAGCTRGLHRRFFQQSSSGLRQVAAIVFHLPRSFS